MTKNIPLSNLSNEELRKKLEGFGTNAGPVTPSTRKLYERKLLKLMEDLPVTEQEEFVNSFSDEKTKKLTFKVNQKSICSRLGNFVKWILIISFTIFISVAFIGSWLNKESKKR